MMVILNSPSGRQLALRKRAPFGGQKIHGMGRANQMIFTPRSGGVNGKAPQQLVAMLQICGKFMNSSGAFPSPFRLIAGFAASFFSERKLPRVA